jgi:hypothetical protein
VFLLKGQNLQIKHLITPGFNHGIFEKTPTRALFKAARKGKSKMVSAINETADSSGRNGGFAKPPQQQ